MSTLPFAHLHCHSHYSLLDGASSIERLVSRTAELGMNSLAITDHGNLFGAVDFHNAAKAKGVKIHLPVDFIVADSFSKDANHKVASQEEGIEAKYCTPAEFTPAVKKNAKFTGPSFILNFFSGSCSLDDDAFIFNKTKQLECVKPEITYNKIPANYSSKYKAAPTFSGKTCLLSKEYGETIQKVLFVFNGDDYPDIKNLTHQVAEEMKTVLGGITAGPRAIADQLHGFMSSLPKPQMPRMPLLPNLNFPGIGGKNNVGKFDGPSTTDGMSYQQLQNAAASYIPAQPVQQGPAQNNGPTSLKDLQQIVGTYNVAST